MNFFIDTNVLIDVLTARDGSAASMRLFAYARMSRVSICISALSFVNAVYICKRQGMNVSDVLHSLKIISSFVSVVDLTGKNVTESLSSNWKDYEDSTQDYCAHDSKAFCIVTHNTKDYNMSSQRILTPEEAIEYIEQN